MKNLKLATICLGFALFALVATEASAGLFAKTKKQDRTEKSEDDKTPRRFDKYPNMQFVGGTLSRDTHSGWKIGEVNLLVRGDCSITADGTDEGWLEEGSKAVVMGSRMGNTISAWSIVVSPPAYKSLGLGNSREQKEPGANPSVGIILKPAE